MEQQKCKNQITLHLENDSLNLEQTFIIFFRLEIACSGSERLALLWEFVLFSEWSSRWGS